MPNLTKLSIGGEVYTIKDAVARSAIANLNSFEYLVSNSAATTPSGAVWNNGTSDIAGELVAAEGTMYRIYLVPSQNGNADLYDEYVTVHVGNAYSWEKIGNTDIDLSGYLTTSNAQTIYATKQNPVFSGSLSMGRAGNSAVGDSSSAIGNETTASGTYAHAEGSNTISNHKSQHVFGEFNVADDSKNTSASRGNYIEIVGNGSKEDARSNARTLDWNGNEEIAGALTCHTSITVGNTTVTEAQWEKIADLASIQNAKGGSF